jgi:ankyrin repeat protein
LLALQLAAQEGHSGLVSFLLSLGCDVHKRDVNGWTSLHYACASSNPNFPEICRLLLKDGGAQVTSLTNDGCTALHFFARGEPKDWQYFEDTIALMIQHGADLNSQTKYGETPLYQAVTQGKIESVKILIRLGADVNLRTK